MGEMEFCSRLAEAGGDGLIVVDFPLEENDNLHRIARGEGIDVIDLIGPYTPPGRRRAILERSRGYAYLISVPGVTGPRNGLSYETLRLVSDTVKNSPVPVALGFGISTPEQARAAFEVGARGVVEGSELARIYSNMLDDMEGAMREVSIHISTMKASLSRG
jgi:tryptophan synthase alpha chain